MSTKPEINKHRIRELNHGKPSKGPVVYWMSRDQRVTDNWALIYAIVKSNEFKTPLYVIFTLSNTFQGANNRHYDFMLRGLKTVEGKLWSKGINFILLKGNPPDTLPKYLNDISASLLISDFDPLTAKQEWKNTINTSIIIPHHEVDAHNIVPCWYASNKLEFGAYTLRPKIKKHLSVFLVDFPDVELTQPRIIDHKYTNWHEALSWLNPINNVKPIDWLIPGEDEALRILSVFLKYKLNGYSDKRNDPTLNWQSNLSPYLHFGQISAQRVAIETLKTNASNEDKDAFLDELIVRRELADNFCLFNPSYSRFSGFPDWAKETTEYTDSMFANTFTPTKNWNMQKHTIPSGMLLNAKWLQPAKCMATCECIGQKKFWSGTCPEEAMRIAIYLNDKYSIDGRDPNGYAGIAWSVGGTHDRAWPERPIFGKIRYMNFEGCKRKFDVDKYIAAHSQKL